MKLPAFIRIAKPAIPRLKASIPVVVALLACVALIWVWIYGPEWQLKGHHPFETQLSRWLVTALFTLLAVCWLTLRAFRRLRYLETLQLQIKTQADDPFSADVARQTEYLNAWKQQLQRHFHTPAFLYRLPWYLVIGASNSGKTSLIKEGCKLVDIAPAERLPTDDSGDLRLQCWLGEQAIIIDPAGELIEQPASGQDDNAALYSRLWQSLLTWLPEQRARQPLNGVILTVDLLQLLTEDKAQREAYTTAISQRLQDLLLSLHCRLPLYVVFSKLDLLYGFGAMYQKLEKAHRESILGVTFSLKTADPDIWRSELEQFWQQWMARLNGAMPDMMLNSVDPGQRSQLFSFTRQMQGLYEAVRQLLEAIVYRGEGTQILLRGVYLTSARQRGQMDDIFTQSAAVQYRLTPQAFPTWPVTDTAPWFTRSLFSEVLLAEPNLAGENRVWLRRARKRLVLCLVTGGVVSAILWSYWHYYYQRNYRAGQEVLAQARTFLAIPPAKGDDLYGDLQLPLLNPIRDATLAYGNYHDKNPLFAEMGLYQGNTIGPYVENTYLQLLRQRFIPVLMSGLLNELNAAPKGSEEKLEILRVMRMLEDGSGRSIPLVEHYMSQRWSQRFKGQRELQQQLMGHLNYALKHTDWRAARAGNDRHAIRSFAPYQQPIQRAQQELGKLSIYQRVYQNLRLKAQEMLPPALNLRDHIGASFDSVFVSANDRQLTIPQLLTRNGLQRYFVNQHDRLIELTVMDSWVLNHNKNVQYSEADRQEIQRQITEQYIGDYVATWRGAMNNLSIVEFDGLPEAISGIEQVISGDQPFRRALQTLRDNTSQPVLADTLTGQEGQALLEKADYRLLSRINRDFAPETAALVENSDRTSLLQSVYQKLMELHRYLLAIQNSPAPGKAALKAVQLRLEQNNSDPIFEVQQQAKNLPEPLNRWVGGLADQAWRVVMMEAIQSLEVEWNDTVVKQYHTFLAGRYPFDPQAKQDVPLSEFTRFFAPKGTLDSFYQQNLRPFVENNLANGSDGQPLIRADVMQQLAQAQKIRDTFFSAQNGLSTQFAVEPVMLSGSKRRSVLNLDGQLLDYAHGRSSLVNLVWPNSMRNSVESRLTLVPGETGKSPRSISFSGPWAQLRLINAGELTNVTSNSFDVRFSVDSGEMTYRIWVDESDNPFAGGLFTHFTLPETLY
ncbi:type VI secretion system membrane subunit TssM [Erwinia sorbitola]|uniref:Type VI secretion system membrane subunit TssM n=1 Tax=Erwinia sorbitola TaxID=2681984 RepID=A0A6I6ESQ9_9GAMM|nr:type VI secretion system membrane subunit TssM [Erwinia sorbitola]MTD26525.1 type VI secretion system membrane subunit TssM [Erwinia sorbitola]QGU88109.1 type VI secretion system membrane subunit TssM [Erwinia sorbitola]